MLEVLKRDHLDAPLPRRSLAPRFGCHGGAGFVVAAANTGSLVQAVALRPPHIAPAPAPGLVTDAKDPIRVASLRPEGDVRQG
jgi:hypothetical protein